MKRRVLCFLLSALILFGVVFSAVPSVSAANYMKSSEKLIALIKSYEGFKSKPEYDYGQYTIGYGSACDPDDYPDGITEAEADKLLRDGLAKHEKSVNTFVANHGLNLKQYQFDALVSFTYNLGATWTQNGSNFSRAVIDGATGNEFIFAISQYNAAIDGGVTTFMRGLMNRRLSEANMYLNGQYSVDPPAKYKYVKFNNNIEGATCEVRAQGYDATTSDVIRAVPSKLGYTFLGWYTAAEGGEAVTTLGPKTTVTELYAHWQKGNGEVDEEGNPVGVAAEYQYTTVGAQAVFETPGGKESGKVAAGKTVSIVADYMDANDIKWGKLSTGGWINLGKTGIQGADASAKEVNLKIKVTTDGVNVRVGPGTEYRSIAKVNYGKEMTITHVQTGGKYTWGRSAEGWICLQYTNYDLVSAEAAEDADKVTAIGVIIGADKVNIRNNPGTDGTKIVGQYYKGDIVKVTIQYKVGNTMWAKTDKGWVSTHYLELTSVKDDSEDSAETNPGETEEKITAVGVIVGTDKVRIRNRPGVNGTEIVGYYERGEVITITLQQKVGNNIWGKTDKGWVSCYYVDLTPIDDEPELPHPEATEPEATEPEATKPEVTEPDPTVPDATEPEATEPEATEPEATQPAEPKPDDGVIAVGVVDNCTVLRVRAGTSTQYKQVDSLAAGTSVNIYEIVTSGSQAWGRIGAGRWICLSYVDFEFIGFDQLETVEAVVANCYNVNVRVGPATKYAIARKLPAGTKVEVGALYIDKDTTWAFTPYGWISLKYLADVEDSDVPEATNPEQGGTTTEPTQPGTGGTGTSERQIGTVTGTNTLRVRSAPGSTNKQVGTLKRGDRVIITETFKVGNTDWGKIGEGQWISLYYVNLSNDAVSEDTFTRTVTASELKIRQAAGADQKQVGTYTKGTQVLVYETVQIGNATWGRTDKGWISLYYTK